MSPACGSACPIHARRGWLLRPGTLLVQTACVPEVRVVVLGSAAPCAGLVHGACTLWSALGTGALLWKHEEEGLTCCRFAWCFPDVPLQRWAKRKGRAGAQEKQGRGVGRASALLWSKGPALSSLGRAEESSSPDLGLGEWTKSKAHLYGTAPRAVSGCLSQGFVWQAGSWVDTAQILLWEREKGLKRP